MQTTTERLLYPRKDAAFQLGVSVRTLDYLIAGKELETRRIGKRVLVTRKSLIKYAGANHYTVRAPDAIMQSKSQSDSSIMRTGRSASGVE